MTKTKFPTFKEMLIHNLGRDYSENAFPISEGVFLHKGHYIFVRDFDRGIEQEDKIGVNASKLNLQKVRKEQLYLDLYNGNKLYYWFYQGANPQELRANAGRRTDASINTRISLPSLTSPAERYSLRMRLESQDFPIGDFVSVFIEAIFLKEKGGK